MGTGKKKIEIKQIIKEAARMVTFSKRRQGLFKKASQLESMTGARVAIVVFSPSGRLYTCGDVNSAIDAHFSDIGSFESRNLNENSAIDAHFPQFHENGARSLVSKNGSVVEYSEIGSSGSISLAPKSGLWDWLEKIEAEECGSLNELLLLKEQLEGTRDKLAEHPESFQAFFM